MNRSEGLWAPPPWVRWAGWAAAVVALASGIRGWVVLRTALPPPPPIAVPSPNGCDLLNRAWMQVGDEGYERLSGTSRALARRLGLSRPNRGARGRRPEPTRTDAQLLADARALLQRYRGALGLARRSMALRFVTVEPTGWWSDSAAMQARPAATAGVLLTLESDAAALAGDRGRAAASALDLLRLQLRVAADPEVIAHTRGISFQGRARQRLWRLVPHLDRARTLEVAQRLQAALREEPSFAALLEGRAHLAHREARMWLVLLLSTPDRSVDMTSAEVERAARGPFPWWLQVEGIALKTDIDHAYKALARAARGAYQEHLSVELVSRDPLAVVGNPVENAQADWASSLMNQARNRMLAAGLALRLYQIDHGGLPGSLSALVPAYLPSVPQDPFGHGEPLRYRPRGDGYLLYSLGPDGRDDSGRPLERVDTSSPGPTRWRGDVTPDDGRTDNAR